MPVFQVGDLVKLNPGHWGYEAEDDFEAIGLILEMRAGPRGRPQARIMWNDVPGHPAWTILDEIIPLE